MADILVLGNGFDMALDLPTSYEEFLKFAWCVRDILSKEDDNGFNNISEYGLNSEIERLLRMRLENNRDNLFSNEYMCECRYNFWLEHFINVRKELMDQGKDKWVDFEAEIARIVGKLEKCIKNEPEGIDSEFGSIDNEEIEDYYGKYQYSITTYREIHDRLLSDLDFLTWMLGYYFANYVDHIIISPQSVPKCIKDIMEKQRSDQLIVINFNYTHTFERLFSDNSLYVLDHIHGEAESDDSPKSCRLVLGAGVGENNSVEFADFKKYFQRILKRSDSSYTGWLESIKIAGNEGKQHNLYFFGHSMDITDSDVIGKLLNDNRMSIIVYYHAENDFDHGDMAVKIKNIEKIVKRNKLIEMTQAKSSRLRFEPAKNSYN